MPSILPMPFAATARHGPPVGNATSSRRDLSLSGWPRDHTTTVALLHDSLRVGVVLDACDIVVRAYESRAPNDVSATGVARCLQVSPSLVALACGPVCINRPAVTDAPSRAGRRVVPCPRRQGAPTPKCLAARRAWRRSSWRAQRSWRRSVSIFCRTTGSYCVPARGLPRPVGRAEDVHEQGLDGIDVLEPLFQGVFVFVSRRHDGRHFSFVGFGITGLRR
jgi:hypothetical protein